MHGKLAASFIAARESLLASFAASMCYQATSVELSLFTTSMERWFKADKPTVSAGAAVSSSLSTKLATSGARLASLTFTVKQATALAHRHHLAHAELADFFAVFKESSFRVRSLDVSVNAVVC